MGQEKQLGVRECNQHRGNWTAKACESRETSWRYPEGVQSYKSGEKGIRSEVPQCGIKRRIIGGCHAGDKTGRPLPA